MEEFHGSAGAPTRPEDRDAPAPLDAGRLGGFLCELQRKRFDGVLNFRCGERSAAIGFRDGTPVTFDDPTPGHTLAEQLIERGQLTRAQCNSVLARMTDGLVEDETVAFFEHAVQLGFLTEDEANVELSSRIRARLIQLFALRDCEMTLEAGTAALLGRREFPQNLGAILYMGVRTFYDENFLTSVHPDPANTFVRLTATPSAIAHHFELDEEETELLRRMRPESSLSELFQDPHVDRVHVLALVLLMRLSQLCEVSRGPFAPKAAARSPSTTSTKLREANETHRLRNKANKVGSRVGALPDSAEPPTQPRGKTVSHAGPLPEAPGARRPRSSSHVGPLPDSPSSSAQRGRSGSQVGPLPSSHSTEPRPGRYSSQVAPLPSSPSAEPRPGRYGSQVAPLPSSPSAEPRPGRYSSQVGSLPDGPGTNPTNPRLGRPGVHAGPPPDTQGTDPRLRRPGAHAGPLSESPGAYQMRGRSGSLPASQPPPPLRGKRGSTSGAPDSFGTEPPLSGDSTLGMLPEPAEPSQRPEKVAPPPDPPAPRPSGKGGIDATQEALLEAAARTARMRRSIPSRRNSKLADPMPAADSGARQAQRRGTSETPAGNRAAVSSGRSSTDTPAQSAAGSRAAVSSGRSSTDTPAQSAAANTNQSGAQKSMQPADPRGDYAKAHLKELIARRKQAASETAEPTTRDSARELREARSLLHAQNYARAEKILGQLVEIEPQNAIWKTYHLWARWRAQPETGEQLLEELQDLSKKLLSQPEHAAFGAYVLGHVFFHNKRDDLAERFFKRAHAADRTNKDAERHLLILERRKQAAAEGGAGANRKLFGIQLPNSKPKP